MQPDYIPTAITLQLGEGSGGAPEASSPPVDLFGLPEISDLDLPDLVPIGHESDMPGLVLDEDVVRSPGPPLDHDENAVDNWAVANMPGLVSSVSPFLVPTLVSNIPGLPDGTASRVAGHIANLLLKVGTNWLTRRMTAATAPSSGPATVGANVGASGPAVEHEPVPLMAPGPTSAFSGPEGRLSATPFDTSDVLGAASVVSRGGTHEAEDYQHPARAVELGLSLDLNVDGEREDTPSPRSAFIYPHEERPLHTRPRMVRRDARMAEREERNRRMHAKNGNIDSYAESLARSANKKAHSLHGNTAAIDAAQTSAAVERAMTGDKGKGQARDEGLKTPANTSSTLMPLKQLTESIVTDGSLVGAAYALLGTIPTLRHECNGSQYQNTGPFLASGVNLEVIDNTGGGTLWGRETYRIGVSSGAGQSFSLSPTMAVANEAVKGGIETLSTLRVRLPGMNGETSFLMAAAAQALIASSSQGGLSGSLVAAKLQAMCMSIVPLTYDADCDVIGHSAVPSGVAAVNGVYWPCTDVAVGAIPVVDSWTIGYGRLARFINGLDPAPAGWDFTAGTGPSGRAFTIVPYHRADASFLGTGLLAWAMAHMSRWRAIRFPADVVEWLGGANVGLTQWYQGSELTTFDLPTDDIVFVDVDDRSNVAAPDLPIYNLFLGELGVAAGVDVAPLMDAVSLSPADLNHALRIYKKMYPSTADWHSAATTLADTTASGYPLCGDRGANEMSACTRMYDPAHAPVRAGAILGKLHQNTNANVTSALFSISSNGSRMNPTCMVATNYRMPNAGGAGTVPTITHVLPHGTWISRVLWAADELITTETFMESLIPDDIYSTVLHICHSSQILAITHDRVYQSVGVPFEYVTSHVHVGVPNAPQHVRRAQLARDTWLRAVRAYVPDFTPLWPSVNRLNTINFGGNYLVWANSGNLFPLTRIPDALASRFVGEEEVHAGKSPWSMKDAYKSSFVFVDVITGARTQGWIPRNLTANKNCKAGLTLLPGCLGSFAEAGTGASLVKFEEVGNHAPIPIPLPRAELTSATLTHYFGGVAYFAGVGNPYGIMDFEAGTCEYYSPAFLPSWARTGGEYYISTDDLDTRTAITKGGSGGGNKNFQVFDVTSGQFDEVLLSVPDLVTDEEFLAFL